MAVQETLRYFGLRAKMQFGLASPEDKGQFVVESLIMVLNHLHATVHWTQVAEGAKDMANTPDILRGINRDAYTKRVEKIVKDYGIDRDKALSLEPDQFFGVAGRAMLEHGVVHVIATSTSPENQRQQSLAEIKREFGRRSQNSSLPPEMQNVLRWFHITGFDQAVVMGEMRRNLQRP